MFVDKELQKIQRPVPLELRLFWGAFFSIGCSCYVIARDSNKKVQGLAQGSEKEREEVVRVGPECARARTARERTSERK